jgi:putative SOS response-associated peptidase YedK
MSGSLLPGKKPKSRYVQLKSGQPFAFAGLWERWDSPDGSTIFSTAIITTQPNDLMREIHNRMPVILPETAHETWLQQGETNIQDLISLLQPFTAAELIAFPVSTLVNNPANESPACIEPLS